MVLVAPPENVAFRSMSVALAITLFLAAPGCGRNEAGRNTGRDGMVTANQDSIRGDTLFHLDIARPSVAQVIQLRSDSARMYQFVEVEVAAVSNPNQRPLTFEVRYQRNGEGAILLGAFSLYPSDNPGTFIVATQAKVGNEGTILLSLVRPPESSDRIRVAVKRIRLR